MQFNPSPKAEYIADAKNIEAHRVVVQNPAVRRGLEVALAQMQRQIADTSDPQFAGALHFRCLGAHDLISIFYNLAETQVATARADTNNLPGNIRPMPQPSKKN